MALGPVVRVYGADRLRRTMRDAGEGFTELRRVNRDAADIASRAAAARAPKRSGRLATTIRASGTQTAGVIRAGRKLVPYAGPIHWGWPDPPRSDPVNMRFGGTIQANPFLSEGAQQSEPVWVPRYVEEMNRLTKQVKGIR